MIILLGLTVGEYPITVHSQLRILQFSSYRSFSIDVFETVLCDMYHNKRYSCKLADEFGAEPTLDSEPLGLIASRARPLRSGLIP